MHRPHTLTLLAGAAAAAALLLPVPAQGAPDPPSGPATRPCFIEPAHWNVALDGPVPRCPSGRGV